MNKKLYVLFLTLVVTLASTIHAVLFIHCDENKPQETFSIRTSKAVLGSFRNNDEGVSYGIIPFRDVPKGESVTLCREKSDGGHLTFNFNLNDVEDCAVCLFEGDQAHWMRLIEPFEYYTPNQIEQIISNARALYVLPSS